jgi:hypothetical protein
LHQVDEHVLEPGSIRATCGPARLERREGGVERAASVPVMCSAAPNAAT